MLQQIYVQKLVKNSIEKNSQDKDRIMKTKLSCFIVQLSRILVIETNTLVSSNTASY